MILRKQLSGHLKEKKNKQIEIDVESQKDSLHNFFQAKVYFSPLKFKKLAILSL